MKWFRLIAFIVVLTIIPTTVALAQEGGDKDLGKRIKMLEKKIDELTKKIDELTTLIDDMYFGPYGLDEEEPPPKLKYKEKQPFELKREEPPFELKRFEFKREGKRFGPPEFWLEEIPPFEFKHKCPCPRCPGWEKSPFDFRGFKHFEPEKFWGEGEEEPFELRKFERFEHKFPDRGKPPNKQFRFEFSPEPRDFDWDEPEFEFEFSPPDFKRYEFKGGFFEPPPESEPKDESDEFFEWLDELDE